MRFPTNANVSLGNLFFVQLFFCQIFSFHPLFIIIFLNLADRYFNANKLYVSLHCVCSIHLLTCHLISCLRSRARQPQIYLNCVSQNVRKRRCRTCHWITMRLFECVCQTVHVMKPTDQLSDKTGDDQCAVAMHHRFLGTFIIMWQLIFPCGYLIIEIFLYIAHRTRRHCLRWFSFCAPFPFRNHSLRKS